MKHQVIVSFGSTHLPAAYIQWASTRLTYLLDDVRLSHSVWTLDYLGTGHWYLNRLAYATTTLSADQLLAKLKAAEAETGRTPENVTIDLDLMQYDDQRYHEKDWDRAYIQELL